MACFNTNIKQHLACWYCCCLYWLIMSGQIWPPHTPCMPEQVLVSVVEIYCERIRDLLASGGVPSTGADNLAVQQDRERGVFVAGATEVRLRWLWNAKH